jgi:hypothetical protein
MTIIRHFWVASNKTVWKAIFQNKLTIYIANLPIIRPKNYNKSLLVDFSRRLRLKSHPERLILPHFSCNMPHALWVTACGRFLLRLESSVFIMVTHEPLKFVWWKSKHLHKEKSSLYNINIPSQYRFFTVFSYQCFNMKNSAIFYKLVQESFQNVCRRLIIPIP